MGQPARLEKNLAKFKTFHPASSMAWSFACRNPCQNPLFDGEDKLASRTFTEDSNCCTPAPAARRDPTPVVRPVVAPLVAFGSADSFVMRYLKDNLQQIVKTIFKARPLPPLAPALVPAPVVAVAPQYEGRCKRLLNAGFLDIYWDKTHLKYYNFFQQCKDHFATAGATGLNRVLFATTFLKDIAFFY